MNHSTPLSIANARLDRESNLLSLENNIALKELRMGCCRDYPVGWVVRSITPTHLSVITFKFEAEDDEGLDPEE